VSLLRRSRLAGYWYPGTAAPLRDALGRMAGPPAAEPSGLDKSAACAVIVPHGGFQQSGRVVGETLSRVDIPRRCIILGPHHSGSHSAWSLMAGGAFETPLGEVAVDEALAERVAASCPLLVVDEQAHGGEHAIEAQLPWLQWLGPPDLAIVPLLISRERPEEFDAVAAALAGVIRDAGEPVLLIASADLTHYRPARVTAERDARLLDAVCALDGERFIRLVQEQQDVVCGYGPIACAMSAARRLGAAAGQVIRYATSADSGGDPDSAIGYAGVLIG